MYISIQDVLNHNSEGEQHSQRVSFKKLSKKILELMSTDGLDSIGAKFGWTHKRDSIMTSGIIHDVFVDGENKTVSQIASFVALNRDNSSGPKKTAMTIIMDNGLENDEYGYNIYDISTPDMGDNSINYEEILRAKNIESRIEIRLNDQKKGLSANTFYDICSRTAEKVMDNGDKLEVSEWIKPNKIGQLDEDFVNYPLPTYKPFPRSKKILSTDPELFSRVTGLPILTKSFDPKHKRYDKNGHPIFLKKKDFENEEDYINYFYDPEFDEHGTFVTVKEKSQVPFEYKSEYQSKEHNYDKLKRTTLKCAYASTQDIKEGKCPLIILIKNEDRATGQSSQKMYRLLPGTKDIYVDVDTFRYENGKFKYEKVDFKSIMDSFSKESKMSPKLNPCIVNPAAGEFEMPDTINKIYDKAQKEYMIKHFEYPDSDTIITPEQEIKLATSEQPESESGRLKAQGNELPEPSDFLGIIENVEFYEKNLRKVQSRMITGLTHVKNGSIQIDDELFATTDKGKVRDNQEDAVLLVKDDTILGFKMMVVADGMGGLENGEVASHKIVDSFRDWFEELSKEQKEHYYANISDIQQSVNQVINDVSFYINRETLGNGGATIVCAIIGEQDTLITNVGDSRAYIVRDGKLEQVSIDDAVVQKLYESGKIPTRDAMRFHGKSNLITENVGADRIENIHSKVIRNKDYDMVLLFSDGVTDCLSEAEIAVITRNTDKNRLSQELVRRALDNTSVAPDEVKGNSDYSPEIKGGKDNTTAAVYVKDKDR